jgi:signal transduction histidine kinase
MWISLDRLAVTGFTLALLILGVIGFLSYRSTRALVKTVNKVTVSHQVIDNLDGILLDMSTAESAARGFVMGGDEVYLEPYRASLDDYNLVIRATEKLVADNPKQQKLLTAVQAAVRDKINFHEQKIALRREQGFDASAALFRTGKGHRLMDEIRRLVTEIKEDESAMLRDEERRAKSDARGSIVTVSAGAFLTLGILISVFFHLSREVNRRKQAETEVRSLNEYLERRVSDRTGELAVVNAELALRNKEAERANQLKSEFLASMSHELRTPLNAIVGFSDLLAEEGAGPMNEKQKRFVEHVRAGSRHLLQLINDILDVSKIEAGRIELHRENFRAGEAIDEVLSVLRPLILNKQLDVMAATRGDVFVYADRVRFKQILYNLLSNAVKFTPERGRVSVEASHGDGYTTVSVVDTGLGIPKEEQAAIFDMFHQAGRVSKSAKEGSGLGLAITRRLVEHHGGEIRVASEPDQGSRFMFTLPDAPSAETR